MMKIVFFFCVKQCYQLLSLHVKQIYETWPFKTYFFKKVLNFLGMHSKGLIIVVTRFPLIKALVSLAFDMWVRS